MNGDGVSGGAEAGAEPSYWRTRWQDGRTSWDSGTASPHLRPLLARATEEGLLKRGAAVLEPGCGRAHHGVAMARLGYAVTAFDVTPEAVAAAQALYGQEANLTIVQADALALPESWVGAFDAVFDRAMLCALPASCRAAYVHAAFTALKPGGVLLSVPFTKLYLTPQEGPPFALTISEMVALLASRFALVDAQDVKVQDPNSKVASEGQTIWRRRPQPLVESV